LALTESYAKQSLFIYDYIDGKVKHLSYLTTPFSKAKPNPD